MAKVFNRARMTTATAGTGTITLGSAVARYQSFAAAGAANGDVVSYCIEDGSAWEVGTGTYTSSGTTLSRTLVQSSTGSLLNLSGSAEVFITALAADFPTLPITGRLLRAPQILTSGTSYTTPAGCTGIYVECVGGGGGGGGCPGTTGTAAPGGGGGGYSAKYFTVLASTSYAYAIGAAGAGNSNAAGGTGGSTTFTGPSSVTITAAGGSGGPNGSTGVGIGGAGGAGSSGDLNLAGQAGGTASNPVSGVGGSAAGFGGGGARGVSNGNGIAGTFGGGGSGAQTTTAAAKTGGAGGAGFIRIWEFA